MLLGRKGGKPKLGRKGGNLKLPGRFVNEEVRRGRGVA